MMSFVNLNYDMIAVREKGRRHEQLMLPVERWNIKLMRFS